MGAGDCRGAAVKILYVSSSSGSRGGGELYLIYLAQAMKLRGHEVHLWASSHARMDELTRSFDAFGRTHRFPYLNTYDRPGRSPASFFDRAGARRAAESWRAIAPDLIHLNKQNLEDGLDLLRACSTIATPTLTTIHLTQSARYLRAKSARLRDWVARRALRKYAGPLVTVLEDRRADLESFLGQAERLHSIPNGVPLADLSVSGSKRGAIRSQLGLDRNAPLIVAVGRMVPQKRPMTFLELAAAIHRRKPEVRFSWIGDGAMTGEWDRRVSALGLGGVVQRIAWTDDVTSYLLAADVFLHVAEFEGLPLAVLEAMSAALPCAITPNLREEMKFLDDANSLAAIADGSWADILDDLNRLREMGQAARRCVEREFSNETMALRYQEVYRHCLDRSA